jgi:hypothetical protein
VVSGPPIVVLAAGLATRYGGLKPLAPVGPAGEAILDLAVADALAAGFGRVVVVVGRSSGPPIRYHAARCWPGWVEREFVVQDPPLGTADALWCARHALGEASFGVANADDLYGSDALEAVRRFVEQPGADHGVLAGFALARTVVSDAPVTRGVLAVDEAGLLEGVAERRKVRPIDADEARETTSSRERGCRGTTEDGKQRCAQRASTDDDRGAHAARTGAGGPKAGGAATSKAVPDAADATDATKNASEGNGAMGWFLAEDGLEPRLLAGSTLVSLNLWGFSPALWPHVERALARLDRQAAARDAAEVLLPEVVAEAGRPERPDRLRVRVVPVKARAAGVTHASDLPLARAVLARLVAEGRRPEDPWAPLASRPRVP